MRESEGKQLLATPDGKVSIPSDYEMKKMMRGGKGDAVKTDGRRTRRRRAERRRAGRPEEPDLELRIEEVLTKKQMAETDPDAVLFESELMKYRPGLSINYIARWCQVTKGQFMYFKNQWAANCWLSKPIAIIPLRLMKLVQRAKRKLDSDNIPKRSSKFEEPLRLFQFEIFLRDDVDLVKLAQCNDSSAFDMRLRSEERKQSAKKQRVSIPHPESEVSVQHEEKKQEPIVSPPPEAQSAIEPALQPEEGKLEANPAISAPPLVLNNEFPPSELQQAGSPPAKDEGQTAVALPVEQKFGMSPNVTENMQKVRSR